MLRKIFILLLLQVGIYNLYAQSVQKLETNPSLQINETKDEVIYNNQILKYQEHIYLILNKPNGYITSTEDYNHQTVMDLINHPLKHKLFPVGRLVFHRFPYKTGELHLLIDR